MQCQQHLTLHFLVMLKISHDICCHLLVVRGGTTTYPEVSSSVFYHQPCSFLQDRIMAFFANQAFCGALLPPALLLSSQNQQLVGSLVWILPYNKLLFLQNYSSTNPHPPCPHIPPPPPPPPHYSHWGGSDLPDPLPGSTASKNIEKGVNALQMNASTIRQDGREKFRKFCSLLLDNFFSELHVLP